MSNLTIEQSTSSSETVTSNVIEKLYNLALTSNVEDLSSTFSMSLKGSMYTNSAYEPSVVYLREKFPLLTITVRDNNFYIKFADSNVERVLVASQYCTDHIGFSLNDASLMSTIPTGLFDGASNSGIRTFAELNKFGAIGISADAFNGNTTLQSINLSTVTSIGNTAFKDCTSLSQAVNIPNLGSIGKEAFRNTAITSVTNLGSTIATIPDNCFRLCQSLTSFNVPQNITSVGNSCFTDDINLTSFDFSNISQISANAFNGSGLSGLLSIPNLSGNLNNFVFKNTKITSVTNLGSIVSICPTARAGYLEGSFQSCALLSSVTIPSTVTIIGAGAFEHCTNLSQVNCAWENLTKIGSSAFLNCANWNFIVNLANLTDLGTNYPFGKSSGGHSIKQIYYPKVTVTKNNGYYSNSHYCRGCFTGMVTDLIYLRDIQTLHPGDFANTTCSALVINNITPPQWNNNDDRSDAEQEAAGEDGKKKYVFGGSTISNIYVPDSAVNTYKNDSNWSALSDKIKGLSELTKVSTEANLQSGQIALILAYM